MKQVEKETKDKTETKTTKRSKVKEDKKPAFTLTPEIKTMKQMVQAINAIFDIQTTFWSMVGSSASNKISRKDCDLETLNSMSPIALRKMLRAANRKAEEMVVQATLDFLPLSLSWNNTLIGLINYVKKVREEQGDSQPIEFELYGFIFETTYTGASDLIIEEIKEIAIGIIEGWKGKEEQFAVFQKEFFNELEKDIVVIDNYDDFVDNANWLIVSVKNWINSEQNIFEEIRTEFDKEMVKL